MSEVFVIPDGGSTTGALTGGASIQAVLSDLTDTSYVTLDAGESFSVTFSDPTIPAGAVVTRCALAVRAARDIVAGGSPRLVTFNLTVDGEADVRTTSLTSIFPIQWNPAVVSPASGLDTDAISATGSLGGSTGSVQVFFAWVGIRYVAQPVVDVGAPTGTLNEDNIPTVSWTNGLDVDGGGQFAANVRIFNEDQYTDGGFDPDTSDYVDGTDFFAADTSWRGTEILPNGNYRAYVRVSQLSNASDWDYNAFTVDVPTPSNPTLVAVGDPDNGRMELTVSGNPGTADTDQIEIQRQDGSEWIAVRTIEGDGIVTGDATIQDYEAPFGETVTYRARAIHNYTSTNAYSAWETDSASVYATQWWVKHPTDPGWNLAVDLRSFVGHDRAARQTVQQPLGREDAIAVSDTRGPETGTITFRCSDDTTRDAIMSIGTLTVPVLLAPPGDHHERNRWVILGDESVSRLIDQYWATERDVTYTWTEVARPEGAADNYAAGLFPGDDLYPGSDLYPE